METQYEAKIARAWHGVVAKQDSEKYYQYLRQTGLKDYQSAKGNCGVLVLRRSEPKRTHFLLITLWESYESIKEFAGKEIEKARYYPKDEAYLLELEPYVKHYEMPG